MNEFLKKENAEVKLQLNVQKKSKMSVEAKGQKKELINQLKQENDQLKGQIDLCKKNLELVLEEKDKIVAT